jgi:hypothetical protein
MNWWPPEEGNMFKKAKEIATRATQLLEDPVLVAAIEAMRLETLSEIQNSKPKDSLKREELYYDLRACDRFLGKLQSTVDEVLVAEHNGTRLR